MATTLAAIAQQESGGKLQAGRRDIGYLFTRAASGGFIN
jgi:hypothetical protein